MKNYLQDLMIFMLVIYMKLKISKAQDYVCLPGQGKHDIIFPRWRHRPEAVSMDRIKASHKANVVALERNSIQRHHDLVNGIFKLNYIQD